MKFNIKASLDIINEGNTEILLMTISPENTTMPKESGEVKSFIRNNVLITQINGKMTLGRLKHTLDDILKAAILTVQVNNKIID